METFGHSGNVFVLNTCLLIIDYICTFDMSAHEMCLPMSAQLVYTL